MSLLQYLLPRGRSGFGYGSTAEQVTEGLDLRDKSYLITGCNAGLGFEAMRVLALRGARVVATARTVEKAAEACAGVQGHTVPVACELADPASVRACVDSVQRAGIMLDGIICNAGIMALPELQTAHGVELQLMTNHIGHFMLVTGLLEQLTPTGRVVVVSSDAHRGAPARGIEFDNLDGTKRYSPLRAYGQSKFANILFVNELARRFRGTQRTANAVHPGVIATSLWRSMNPIVAFLLKLVERIALKSVAQGAATELYVATNPALAGVSGLYFSNSNVSRPRHDAADAALGQKLWAVSEEIVAKL